MTSAEQQQRNAALETLKGFLPDEGYSRAVHRYIAADLFKARATNTEEEFSPADYTACWAALDTLHHLTTSPHET